MQQPTSTLYPWLRLSIALVLSTIGGVGMWAVVVVLPQLQTEFAVARGSASLPYTFTMIGFAITSLFMGRLTDRVGIFIPVVLGALAQGTGLLLASYAPSLVFFIAMQGLLIGAGCSVTFAPLIADTSLWFKKRRGLAVAIVASGNYFAGAIWPPLVAHLSQLHGWRTTYFWLGVFCIVAMLPLSLWVRRRAPMDHPIEIVSTGAHVTAKPRADMRMPLGWSPLTLQLLLIAAGVGCCVAMSMPQVHIVAYCGDLGYGPTRGAQMLSLMLVCGIVSRISFGWISDHIGGLRTLLLGSALQGLALLMYLPSNGLTSLYVVSALFGLFQGGIVPSYAIIVREYFPPREAGMRISMVITSTMLGMALGGWMTGVIFDLTGSYRVAFINGIVWNAFNLAIATALWRRARLQPTMVHAAAA